MSSISVQNIPDKTLRALQVRAAKAGWTLEEEVVAIIESVVRPSNRIKLGILLAEISQQAHGADLVFERDKTISEPFNFNLPPTT
jgi:plasmid stability protein